MVSKITPETHILIVDTNILWYKDKAPAVNPDFDSFWEEHTKIAAIELVIPTVVRGELLFQQTTSAVKAFDKAQENMGLVSAITQKNHKRRTRKETIKRQVTAKFDKWLKAKKGVVRETPFSAIDWSEVRDSAVWRQNVFSPDAKNPESEKGFRDRLILETVVHISKNENRKKVKIAFVCDDYLLRENTEARLTSDTRFSCYENLEDFSTYLKLTHEKLTDKFIKSIMSRASRKFFTSGDPKCLYYRENVKQKIIDKFGDYFKYPETSERSGLRLRRGLQRVSESWRPSVSSNWRITKPEFTRLEGNREYHWTIKVERAITFKKEIAPTGLGLFSRQLQMVEADEKTLFLEFSVAWRANVRTNGTFHDVTLIDIQMSANEFRIASEEEKEHYGLFAKSVEN